MKNATSQETHETKESDLKAALAQKIDYEKSQGIDTIRKAIVGGVVLVICIMGIAFLTNEAVKTNPAMALPGALTAILALVIYLLR